MLVAKQNEIWTILLGYLRYSLKVFIISGIVFILVAYLMGERGYADLSQSFFVNGLLSTALFLGNGILADKLPISWLTQPKLRLFISVVGTIVITLAVTTLIAMLTAAINHGDPMVAIRKWYWPYHRSVLVLTAFISLFLHGRRFFIEYKQSIEEKEALKRTQISSRLESLQNQINPHFLFNSLNVLSTLVHQDPDKAEQFIQKLSGVYRFVLAVRDAEVVPLEQELEALESYLFLLSIRFGDALVVKQEIVAREGEQIPPLCLQMLVENAIKHNVVSRNRPLTIHIARVAEESIKVQNNLRRKAQNADSLGIGLANIKERYSYLSNQQIEVRETSEYFEVIVPVLFSN